MNSKFFKSKLFLFLLLLVVSSSNKFSYIICNASEIETISPLADTYVYKYRRLNGVLQKRLWNDSQKVWAEPYWHNV